MERAAILAAAAALALGATGLAAYAAQGSIPKYVAEAVADKARPASDSERDANRKPAETLAFAGVKPGDAVVELAPGRGYYTRLLSAVVGPKGSVTTISSIPKPDAPPPPVKAIAEDPHYANVHPTFQKLGEVTAPADSDVVWTTQNYHDFHNIPDVNVATLNKTVFDALKPGGVYFVLDHSAEAGSGL